MQTITLQFGPAAERLGNHFWNAQDALIRWAEYKGKPLDKSKYFANAESCRTPRMVSLMPTEPKEVIGEFILDDDDRVDDLQIQTATSPRELFPHITLNKRTVQRMDIQVNDDLDPYYCGLMTSDKNEEFMDSIRYFAEECDRLNIIQTFTSDDCYGGYGASLMETIMDDYEKKTMMVFSIPSVDLQSSWESKALSLYANNSCSHVPFALMKPVDLEWSVSNYEPIPIFASAIDTINSSTNFMSASLQIVGSIAYGMKMECDAIENRIQPVIDLMSFASPSFDMIACSSERDNIPSYIKMNGHGYIAHHSVASYGVPTELPDYLEDICQFIKKSNNIRRVDRDLHDNVTSFLLDLADK